MNCPFCQNPLFKINETLFYCGTCLNFYSDNKDEFADLRKISVAAVLKMFEPFLNKSEDVRSLHKMLIDGINKGLWNRKTKMVEVEAKMESFKSKLFYVA